MTVNFSISGFDLKPEMENFSVTGSWKHLNRKSKSISSLGLIIWELIIKQSFLNIHYRTRTIPQKYPKSSNFHVVVFLEASNLQRQPESGAYCTVRVAENALVNRNNTFVLSLYHWIYLNILTGFAIHMKNCSESWWKSPISFSWFRIFFTKYGIVNFWYT